MASVPLSPLPEWQADFDRRKAAGQIGWQQRLSDGRTRSWDLTPWNSMSEFSDTVRPIYNCPTCGGNGCVDENGKAVD